MEEKIKVQVRPVRAIAYGVFLLADYFFLLYMRNYFWMMASFVMTLLPILSLVGVYMTCKRIRPSLGAGASRIACGDRVPLEFRMDNPCWYPVLDSQIQLHIRNSFLENKNTLSLSMPVRIHGKTKLRLPLELTDLGRFEFEADQICLQDLLGIVRFKRKIQVDQEIYSIPYGEKEEGFPASQYLAGARETEESKERGNDFSEISEIRKYIPGDRIRDIHWKLSAKEDELMVKQRVSVAGSELVLVLNFDRTKELLKKELSYAYGVGLTFVDLQQPVCFLAWNSGKKVYEEFRFSSRSSMEEAFANILGLAQSLRRGDANRTYLKTSFPFMDHYLEIEMRDNACVAEMKNL